MLDAAALKLVPFVWQPHARYLEERARAEQALFEAQAVRDFLEKDLLDKSLKKPDATDLPAEKKRD
jgi:hypothetical protein